MLSNTQTFCYAPWTNIEIMQNGKILPCCKFQDKHYQINFNITNNSIQQYQTGQYLSEIKQQFLKGQWPKGCERCQLDEENNFKSKRQIDYSRWKDHYDRYKLDSDEYLTAGLAFGNTCNIKCTICGPHASSKWIKEYRDLFGIELPKIESFRKSVINSLTDFAPNIIHLDIYGGEPFLSGIQEQSLLLDSYITSGQSQNITIHYTTNGTIWPEQWIHKWKHFKSVEIQYSIDGILDRFEYLRYPANWKQVEKNVFMMLDLQKENSNLVLSVCCTISALNIYYIDDVWNWCKQIGLPRPWPNQVYNPKYFSPGVWSDVAKEFIINKLRSSSQPEIKNWANILSSLDESYLFDEFKSKLKNHDLYRKLNYSDAFFDMAKFL